jgi:hypothetical protein
MREQRRIPSPGTVLAVFALILAMGGAAYAGSKINTNDIKNKAVTKPKIDKKAVNKSRLANNAVTEKALKNFTIGKYKTANEGETKTLLSIQGWVWRVRCEGGKTHLELLNQSAGDDGAYDDNVGGGDDTIPEGVTEQVYNENTPNDVENGGAAVYGSKGSHYVLTSVFNDPTSGYKNADCVAQVHLSVAR